MLAALAQDRRQDDVDLLHQLADRARARGDGDEARTRLAAVAALRPDLPSLAIELARLDGGRGRHGSGRSPRCAALAARLPDDPAALVALGKLLHRMGQARRGARAGCAPRWRCGPRIPS